MAQKLVLPLLIVFIGVATSLKLDLIRDEYAKLGTKMDFYDEEYQNGNGHSVNLGVEGACKNLPRRWLKKPVSVDTRGTCGSVCTEKDCQGVCILIIPGTGDQMLSQVKMSKRIQSVQGCFVEGSQKGKA